MTEKPKLPLLPGFVVHNKPKTNHHTKQHWVYNSGTRMFVEKEHADINSESRDGIFRKPTLYPPNTAPQLPDWVVYDRKILCFTAYFQEGLQDTSVAKYQIREVKILYYLEDGTIQVVEPRKDNSGISQGCIVSRQRVPRRLSSGDDFLSILDLNVQQDVMIFDRLYTIADCDLFTRKFLNRAGIPVPESVEVPRDPTEEVRCKMEESLQPKKKMPAEIDNKLEKFLKYDKKCLKFDAYWDDRESMYGDIRDFVVLYYLTDDSIQIDEKVDENSGRSGGILLKRQKLPKANNGLLNVGEKTNLTLLNVLGGGLNKGRFVRDRLHLGKSETRYYTDDDLRIGVTLNVFGREVVLIDCDGFTRDYLHKKYGIEEFIPLQKPVRQPSKWSYVQAPERVLPPFNGWGTHEDSEGNCKTIEPKPPHRDMAKFLKLDRVNLRFQAKMISDFPENDRRLFIITYYLNDDTISIYESSGRNSGFRNGDFYKRSKFYLPNQEWLSSDRPKQYLSQHFYIGVTVTLKDFVFKLTNADEFTLNYMETHPFEYPVANINSILSKIKKAIEPVYKEFVARYLGNLLSTGQKSSSAQRTYICFDTMRGALIDLLGPNITEHEIITFLRHFSASKSQNTKTCDRNFVQALVHAELNRHLWDDVTRLKEHIYHIDPINYEGFLPKQKVRSIISACRLPIKDVLVDEMFSVLTKNENDEIDVKDFVYFIDRFQCKVAPVQPISPYDACDMERFENRKPKELIDWSAFIEALKLEENLKHETD